MPYKSRKIPLISTTENREGGETVGFGRVNTFLARIPMPKLQHPEIHNIPAA